MNEPAGAMAEVKHAIELWQRGERVEAERELVRLLRDHPDDPGALRSLAEIYVGSGRAPCHLNQNAPRTMNSSLESPRRVFGPVTKGSAHVSDPVIIFPGKRFKPAPQLCRVIAAGSPGNGSMVWE
jgi:hypothetical protein